MQQLTRCIDCLVSGLIMQKLFWASVKFADAAGAFEQAAAAAAQECLYATAALAICGVAHARQDWINDVLGGLYASLLNDTCSGAGEC
jgi:hypothetical protein